MWMVIVFTNNELTRLGCWFYRFPGTKWGVVKFYNKLDLRVMIMTTILTPNLVVLATLDYKLWEVVVRTDRQTGRQKDRQTDRRKWQYRLGLLWWFRIHIVCSVSLLLLLDTYIFSCHSLLPYRPRVKWGKFGLMNVIKLELSFCDKSLRKYRTIFIILTFPIFVQILRHYMTKRYLWRPFLIVTGISLLTLCGYRNLQVTYVYERNY